MKSALAVFAVTFPAVSSLFAQVHIKENATITPGQAKKVQDGGSNSHSIRIEMLVSPEETADVWMESSCMAQTKVQLPGSCPSTLVIDALPAGTYGFSYGEFLWTAEVDSYVCDNQNINIYFDDSLMYTLMPHVFCYYMQDSWITYPLSCSFSTSYFSKFNLSLGPGQLSQGDVAWVGIDGYDDCSKTAWMPSDPVAKNITSGAQYVSFHRVDPQTGADTKIGTEVTTDPSDPAYYLPCRRR